MEALVNKKIIVLCAWCGKVIKIAEWQTTEEEYKKQVMKGRWVSHGMCKECFEKLTQNCQKN